jgi:hypothetical protein
LDGTRAHTGQTIRCVSRYLEFRHHSPRTQSRTPTPVPGVPPKSTSPNVSLRWILKV